MADVTHDGSGSGYATELPSRNLPPVPYADLPEPVPLGRVLGPSVLLLAGSIGSGEFVLWPYISTQIGMVLVWLATIGILTQYFLNMEITRYTLATGETAITGFARLWKHWSWLFILMTVLPWMWPGWATGSATALTFALGLPGSAVVPITIATLVLIGVVLTVSPVVYRTMEKIQFFLVALIVLFLIYVVVAVITGAGWLELARGFTTRVPDIPSAIAAVPAATLLGAIAFAGAGGSLNLAQSNWVRDKGLGMGSRIPKIVSPVTGQEEAVPSIGYFFPQDDANLGRWRDWWRLAHREQFTTFFIIGLTGILVFMTLTFVTVGTGSQAQDFAFIRLMGESLQQQAGAWLGVTFWLVGMVVLLSTNLAVLDMVGRVTADILKTNWLRSSTRWTESRLYFLIVWAEIVFGSLILLMGVDQPLILLIIASSLNGIVMFVYSTLLIRLNRGVLPRAIGLGGVRLGALWWAVLFYGGFSLFTVWDQGRVLVSTLLGG